MAVLYNGNFYTGKAASSYWIDPHGFLHHGQLQRDVECTEQGTLNMKQTLSLQQTLARYLALSGEISCPLWIILIWPLLTLIPAWMSNYMSNLVSYNGTIPCHVFVFVGWLRTALIKWSSHVFVSILQKSNVFKSHRCSYYELRSPYNNFKLISKYFEMNPEWLEDIFKTHTGVTWKYFRITSDCFWIFSDNTFIFKQLRISKLKEIQVKTQEPMIFAIRLWSWEYISIAPLHQESLSSKYFRRIQLQCTGDISEYTFDVIYKLEPNEMVFKGIGISQEMLSCLNHLDSCKCICVDCTPGVRWKCFQMTPGALYHRMTFVGSNCSE